jgi:hypothetical protein
MINEIRIRFEVNRCNEANLSQIQKDIKNLLIKKWLEDHLI